MQETKARRSNAERTQAMRQALVAAARILFTAKGYAETSTPEIVALAQVTRGALYHHFEDKMALFRTVVREESAIVAAAIDAASEGVTDAFSALEIGADAYLDAMAAPGRTRLLLIDGPAVLGRAEMAVIDRETSAGTLVEGLSAATGIAQQDPGLVARALLLAAAFDRAALDIAAGGAPLIYRTELKRMLAAACRPA